MGCGTAEQTVEVDGVTNRLANGLPRLLPHPLPSSREAVEYRLRQPLSAVIERDVVDRQGEGYARGPDPHADGAVPGRRLSRDRRQPLLQRPRLARLFL